MALIARPAYLEQTWLQAALVALPEVAVGEDAKFNDDFMAAKREINKPGSLDHEHLQTLCKDLLAHTTKDLRIAGYLLLSLTFTEGIIGLIKGLHLYQGLLDLFFKEIYPQVLSLKISSLEWLNSPRLLAYVKHEQWLEQASEKAYLKQALSDFNGKIAELLQGQSDTIPRLKIFDEWLQEDLVSSLPAAPIVLDPMIQNTQPYSDTQADENIKQLITYYWNKENGLRAAAYSRALRWSNLTVLEHQNQITKIPPPRAVARNILQQAIMSQDPLRVYKQCENLFLEAGGQVWFDLQYHAYNAAKQLEQIQLATYIADQLRHLLERLPGIGSYYFSDHTPFASLEAQGWFSELLRKPDPLQSTQAKPAEHFAWLRNLFGKTQGKQLQEALRILQDYSTQNESEVFQVRYAMAKLCQGQHRYDLAYHLLVGLLNKIDEFHLEKWEPKLTFEMLETFLSVIVAWAPKVEVNLRMSLMQRKENLLQRLCELNPTAVATRHSL